MAVKTLLKAALWLVTASVASSGCGTGSVAPSSTHPPSDLERLVGDLCGKEVVFLGEGAEHDGDATLAVKVAVVRDLIDHCGFNTLMFESQVYDFYDLGRLYRSKQATPEHLYDAIGGLWSTSGEIDNLVPYLHSKATTGQVTLWGLDPQMGGATQLFTQQRLARELASVLSEERKTACAEEIHRHTSWQYGPDSPYDEAAKARLLACAREIQGALAAAPAGEKRDGAALMAANLVRYLTLEEANYFNARDEAMFRNFEAQLAWRPSPSKVILWGATVHGFKAPIGDRNERYPLGVHLRSRFGDRYATIGFTAGSGFAGRQAQPVALAPPALEALETKLPPRPGSEWRYLGRSELATLGHVPAYLIGYAQPRRFDWSELLDGVVVLRAERPRSTVRPARPLQAPPP